MPEKAKLTMPDGTSPSLTRVKFWVEVCPATMVKNVVDGWVNERAAGAWPTPDKVACAVFPSEVTRTKPLKLPVVWGVKVMRTEQVALAPSGAVQVLLLGVKLLAKEPPTTTMGVVLRAEPPVLRMVKS